MTGTPTCLPPRRKYGANSRIFRKVPTGTAPAACSSGGQPATDGDSGCYRRAKVVAISPDYAKFDKFADNELAVKRERGSNMLNKTKKLINAAAFINCKTFIFCLTFSCPLFQTSAGIKHICSCPNSSSVAN